MINSKPVPRHGPWACGCGERNGGGFDLCWRCGSSFEESVQQLPHAPRGAASTMALTAAPATAQPGWTCSSCARSVPAAEDRCSFCGTTMEGVINPYYARPLASDAPPETFSEEPGLHINGDERAQLAWRAALLGFCLLPALLHLYSFVLLVRLSLEEPWLSRRGLRHFYGALLIDLTVMVLAGLFLPYLIG